MIDKLIMQGFKPLLTVALRPCVHEGDQRLGRQSHRGGRETVGQQQLCCLQQQQHVTCAVDLFPAQQRQAGSAVHRLSAGARPESGSAAPENNE